MLGIGASLQSRTWVAVVAAIAVVGVADVRGQRAAGKDARHPFTFRVEVEGHDIGFFRSVSGLSIETEVVEFREGGSELVHKLPGAKKYPNIVLKRGFTGDTALYDWYSSITRENTARVDGSIVMLDQNGTEVARWNFYNGWPSKWHGPDFDASSNEVAIETLEIAHEGLRMSTPGNPEPPRR